jgi:hypothetical protein
VGEKHKAWQTLAETRNRKGTVKMTVLDATNIESESDITEVDRSEEIQQIAGESGQTVTEIVDNACDIAANAQIEIPVDQVRTLTLAVPAEAELETKIVLAVQRSDDGWRSDFRVDRTYDTNPYEQTTETDVWCFDGKDNCYDLGESFAFALDDVAHWISSHSNDEDEKAAAVIDCLESLYQKFKALPENEAIALLDPLPEPEKKPETEPAAIECGCGEQPSTVAITATITLPTDCGIDKAATDFNKRKLELQESMCIILGEVETLAEKLKGKKAQLKEASKEYHEHLARGPERLPLIDQAKPTPSADTKADNQPLLDAADAAEPAAVISPENARLNEAIAERGVDAEAVNAADDDSWRKVTVQDAGIPEHFCKILNHDNCIYTLGQLADFTQGDGERGRALTELKKIGESKAAKIEEAMDKYWAEHPRK